jgi:hypothetical protein
VTGRDPLHLDAAIDLLPPFGSPHSPDSAAAHSTRTTRASAAGEVVTGPAAAGLTA